MVHSLITGLTILESPYSPAGCTGCRDVQLTIDILKRIDQVRLDIQGAPSWRDFWSGCLVVDYIYHDVDFHDPRQVSTCLTMVSMECWLVKGIFCNSLKRSVRDPRVIIRDSRAEPQKGLGRRICSHLDQCCSALGDCEILEVHHANIPNNELGGVLP